MKLIRFNAGILFLIILSGVIAVSILPVKLTRDSQSQTTPELQAADQNIPYQDAGCTVIYGTDGAISLGGNNEDYSDPSTMAWFLPPEEGKYGRVYFGYEGYIWGGGVNDQGLFFDALAVDEPVNVFQGNKPLYQGSLPDKALSECIDVSCVLDLFEEYHSHDTWMHQFMFGDASGNSVIIEPTREIPGGKTFQVATNFYQSTTEINDCRYCDRYWTAKKMFEDARGLSVELIRDILNAVHLEDDYPTLYSTIYDLNQNLIYLYFFHNYEEVVVFDLAEEFQKGYHSYVLADLFTETDVYQEWSESELNRLAEIRASYQEVIFDPGVFDPYLGDYQGPADMDMAFSYYSIGYERGELVLKLKPDKAWLKLTPTSENTFYHASTFNVIEILFSEGGNGERDQFTYRDGSGDYTFTRKEDQPAEIAEEPEVENLISELIEKLYRFTGTYTFKLLSIILILLILQFVLSYLGSLLE